MPKFLEHSATSWKGQRLEHQRSIIDQLDPRLRLIAALLFALVIGLSNSLIAPGLGLLVALSIALSARLNVRRTLRRVIAMDIFMLFLLLMLPFTVPGDPLFQIGDLVASEQGLIRACDIALKANAIILALLSLVGTMEATTLGHALSRLAVPDKMVHLLLFTVRYLDVISREYKRMRRAMKARAFVAGSNRHTWRSMGFLIGMLLVRSLERSERILAAMKCRGFSGKLYLLDEMNMNSLDYSFVFLLSVTLLTIGGLNFL